MTNPDQLLFFKHSGCGNYINIVERFGRSRQRNSFKLNNQTSELSLSNGRSKCIYTVEGNKLIYKQYGKKEITIVREFSLTHCIATYIVDKIVAKKYFLAENRGTISFGF